MDAIRGITDLVEALHHTVNSLGGVLGAPGQDRTTGITGMVYRSIHNISDLVEGGVDSLLQRLSASHDEAESSAQREAVLAVVNGVLGDHLEARHNPLAIPMQFRRQGRPVTGKQVADILRQSQGRIVLLVHGACMNDLQWNRKDHDHGAALARDVGAEPLYLHYNTGLHVSENGKRLSSLLASVCEQSDMPIDLVIVAHSMGGLVCRSACHYAQTLGHGWLQHLRKLVFLGTPHHGSLLERGGNLIDVALEISPYSTPFSRLGKIRSAGVTDLRFGNIVEEDWQGRNRFEPSGDQRKPVPLPHQVRCYAIAATMETKASVLGDDVVGDGLVTVKSALGISKNSNLHLSFPTENQWVGRGLNHFDLLSDPETYETIRTWLTT
jgi:pimeloyl-ACP methyl ester carboxylesterase